MSNICVIYDEDSIYAKKLMNIFSLYKNIPFSVQMFTDLDELKQYLSDNTAVMLIISEKSLGVEAVRKHKGPVMVLVENENDIKLRFRNCGVDNAVGIYKYQSGESIVNEVIRESGCDFGKKTADVKVTGVFTPADVGTRTQFALNLARCMNEQVKTLYINLEEFAGLSAILPQSNNMTLSDAIYFYRQNGEYVNERIRDAICSINGIDYIPPVQCAKDIEFIMAEQFMKFVYDIAKYAGYENVVLDIANAIKQQTVIIAGCSMVYMPVSNDYLSLKKVENFEMYYLSSDMENILNKIKKIHIPENTVISDDYLERKECDGMYSYVRNMMYE